MPHIVIEDNVYFYASGKPDGKEPAQGVVFVHGAGGSHRHWLPQLQALKRDYLVYAVDLPGHGRSGGRACDQIAAYREFIRAFAAQMLPDRPFYLAGHSMGGAIALDFARYYPLLLKGIILVGTGARLRVLPAMLEAFRRGESYDLTALAYSNEAPDLLLRSAREELAGVPPAVLLADYTACDHFDLMPELSTINVPALVISADRDQLTPLKYGRYLADTLPRAELAVVHGAGHMMMLEEPARVNDILRHFLTAG
ncbi:alpha/beta fold hydrolase [Desulfotomaculum copahuensis]|uniref:Alpha/beta hydrolase n=1 Tax=Desulfotomaculum copahuensis TaxID=1838280 RepID=A0A1B7LE44_9FIRM|nr:alpha/beta hydrolase [Desulfotomaculum copahuensis]OAT81360.1 alpha/beta hydrolase [Desulfotomaculum copahuensis]